MGLVERKGSLTKGGGGGPNCFISFSSEKHVLITIETIFSLLLPGKCACCNQYIYYFMWFTFYQKMIYYEISFPVTPFHSFHS